MTWSIGKLFCEDMNMILCSRDEIFPFSNNQTIPYAIGILSGDQYAPIRWESSFVFNRSDHPVVTILAGA